MNTTVVLSKYLQEEDIDICRAQENITHAIEVLKDKRQKSEEFFRIIFKNAKKVMEALDVTIRIPRLKKK